jgi:hypothetical protein
VGRPVVRSKRSRVGVLIGLLGGAVLGVSLYAWSRAGSHHRLFYTEHDYQWVRADASRAEAVDSDEIWQATATCQLPYFVKATLQAKAKLQAYNDAVPDEIRALRERPGRRLPADTPFYYFLKREQEERARNIAGTDYDAQLHAKYTEWYVTVSKLEDEVRQWEERLRGVADRSTAFSDAAGGDAGDRAREPERAALIRLGLGSFPEDQQQAIRAACVNVIPMKKIIAKTHYRTEIWRWPVDHAVAFWFGVELVLLGVLFSPIATWISTGDFAAAWRHGRDAAERFIDAAARFIAAAERFLAAAGRFLARNTVLIAIALRRRLRASARWCRDWAGKSPLALRLSALLVGVFPVPGRMAAAAAGVTDQNSSVSSPQNAELTSSSDHSEGFNQNSLPSRTTNAIIAETHRSSV